MNLVVKLHGSIYKLQAYRNMPSVTVVGQLLSSQG